MGLIVSIETATNVCSVAVHRDGNLIGSQVHHQEKSASSLLPVIVNQMLDDSGISMEDVQAIAVSSGPGSYTGLRIGVSTAKGLAFGLNVPLIGIPTLEAMVLLARKSIIHSAYFCPMIDARRMEVYCELYSDDERILEAHPLVVEANSFSAFLDKPIYLFGNGAEKTREVLKQENIYWIPDVYPLAAQIGVLAERKFINADFEDLAYFEPIYLKEFQAKPAKKLV